jgi:adenylate cyclase
MPVDAYSSDDPVMRQIAHHVHVDFAWCKNAPVLAKKHAASVASIAEKHPNPYSKVFALSCNGLSQLTARDFNHAKQAFSEALKLIKSTNVAVDFEAEMLAGLAECHQHLGNFEQALVSAKEAVATSMQRSNRLAECRARIVWGAALAAQGVPHGAGEAEIQFEQAAQLIALTGAKIFENALIHARATGLPVVRRPRPPALSSRT